MGRSQESSDDPHPPGLTIGPATVVLALLIVLLLPTLASSASGDPDDDLVFTAPLEGSTVSGKVPLIVDAGSNVTTVTFFCKGTGDWQLMGTGQETAPGTFNITWDTRGVPDGVYSVRANGTLVGGGEAEAVVEDIVVDNTVPGLLFIAPKRDARLSGEFNIIVQASTDVASMSLFLDKEGTGAYQFMGNATRVPLTSNWTYLWDTRDIGEKRDVSLIAIALDAANNEGRTFALGLWVDNVPPSVGIKVPCDNATLDGFVLLEGNTTETRVTSAYFEWRVKSGTWIGVGPATFNATLGIYVHTWNTYEVGEYTGVEVRFVVVDDLGQHGYASAYNVTITDLPPVPTILSPSPGDHLTGTVDLDIASDDDTQNVSIHYSLDDVWHRIGFAERRPDGTWHLTWDTAGISVFETSIRVVALDAKGPGEALLAPIEVDNTPPVPNILNPTEAEFHIYGLEKIVATSDRDTTSVTFRYEEEGIWKFIGKAKYNPNNDRWEYTWNIQVYVRDSALCATAVDEVGLAGDDVLTSLEIGIPEDDEAPYFLSSMPGLINLKEDEERVLDLSKYIYDDDLEGLRIYAEGEQPGLFRVFDENIPGNSKLRFIPTPNQYGEATIELFLVDSADQVASANLTVLIESVPDPPFFRSVIPNLFVQPEIPYEFDYGPYIEDPDTDHKDLTVLLPDDVHISKNSSNQLSLVFLYTKKELGKVFPVYVTVRDVDGMLVNRSIIVSVVNNFVPVQRKEIPDLYMIEDSSLQRAFDLDEYFFDPDHDTLYFSYGNTHVRVVIGNSYPHSVGIYLPANWWGTDIVTFRATDPTGALLEDTIQIHVNSSNDPPRFKASLAIPRLVIRENLTYDLDLTPYVEDVEDELGDLTVYTNSPFVTRSPLYALGLRFNFPYRREGLGITVTVEDPEGGKAETDITVDVTDNHPPIMRRRPSNVVMKEGENWTHAFDITTAWDQDWASVQSGSWRDLTFQFICQRTSFVVGEAGWVDIRLLDPDWNTYDGDHDIPELVILRVLDDRGGFSEYAFYLTVLPVNDPPVVSPVPQIIVETGVQAIDLTRYIKDVDTPFQALEFKFVDRNNPSLIVTSASVHGGFLYLDYRGSDPRHDLMDLVVVDGEYEMAIALDIVVKVDASGEQSVSWWLVILVAAATGLSAMYVSKFVWGRFEPPSVQDVFLVYGDGVIIRHMSKRGTLSMDEDLAIAMLTAIGEFVQQSMRSAQLKSMQAGDHNILIERDPNRMFYIAVIHTGTVSEELRRAINSSTICIKTTYGHVLKRWDGNMAKFDGVEKCLRDILAISHVSIPEGVRFEQEGITSIEPGKTFLFQGKDVTRTHNIFRGLVKEQGAGLLVSRVHPQRLHPSIPEAGAECIWLSKTPTKRGVSPSNTTMILHEVTTFIRENERSVVCLDGLEYLLVHNPLDEVVAFVNELTDMVQLEEFIMMVHVDPDALDEATLARLSRDMVPVSDRR